MPFAAIDGLSMHYKSSGSADLPVLVFSNSLGANLDVWDGQAEVLKGHVQVLRYDTRGHGESGIGRVPFSIADLARDVLRLLDSLKIERASFCGLSMGGVIGQWLGIHAPERLDKLILCNTAAKIGNSETWDARIETVLREGLAPVIPGTLERWFTADFRRGQPESVARVREMLETTDVRGYAGCCAAIRDADFRKEVATIGAPTLVIAGSDDPVTTTMDALFLASTIHGAQYIELKAAHLSNLGAMLEFNAALFNFLINS